MGDVVAQQGRDLLHLALVVGGDDQGVAGEFAVCHSFASGAGGASAPWLILSFQSTAFPGNFRRPRSGPRAWL
ncbi:hypothetical protein AZA_88423 [Nitrospirillum viridazoti Y2]|nr:hypothetical protein AZA_88423 [Nitrospirillum amazonense Y2]